MNNIAAKLQKCWTHKIAFKIISKILKQPNFFHSQPSTLSKEALCKVLPFGDLWFIFMISSVAPTRSSTSYALLVTKIGNRNLKTRNINHGNKFPLKQELPRSSNQNLNSLSGKRTSDHGAHCRINFPKFSLYVQA